MSITAFSSADAGATGAPEACRSAMRYKGHSTGHLPLLLK